MKSTRNPDGLEPFDPDDVTNYGIDWRDWLEDAETIVAESWSIDPTVDAPDTMPRGSFTDGATAITLSNGGVVGTTYTLTCQATKSNGEKKTRSFRVVCAEG